MHIEATIKKICIVVTFSIRLGLFNAYLTLFQNLLAHSTNFLKWSSLPHSGGGGAGVLEMGGGGRVTVPGALLVHYCTRIRFVQGL